MPSKESWRTPGTVLALSGTVIGLVSLIVSIGALMASCAANETMRKDAERKGLLEMSTMSAYLTNTLTGTEREGDAPARKVTGVRGPVVDITLRNRGSGPSLIDKITVTVTRSENLGSCWATGGPLKSTADYQFSVPLSRKPPFTISKNVHFQVPSADHQRFKLTIGPDGRGSELTPWIGVVTIRLHDTDGSDLDIGPIALVDAGQDSHLYPDGVTWKIGPSGDPKCMRLNARTVESVTRTPGIRQSLEFTALHHALNPPP